MPIDIGPRELGAVTEQQYATVIPQIPQNGSLTFFDLSDFIKAIQHSL
jgi:hypothetical protein